jgi:FAD/FMN-containing dehydrogenase
VTDDASKHSETILVAGGGCITGDIIQQATDMGVTIPLGSRPSVGAGLWLQGGIGHLTRLHGLASDAILGAVMVSPATGDILYVGTVPAEHRPTGSSRPENEDEILWALRGAGNQVAIVLSVVFRTVPAYTFAVANWNLPLLDRTKPGAPGVTLQHFSDHLAAKLSKSASSDAYIHWCPKTRQICL